MSGASNIGRTYSEMQAEHAMHAVNSCNRDIMGHQRKRVCIRGILTSQNDKLLNKHHGQPIGIRYDSSDKLNNALSSRSVSDVNKSGF